MRPPIERLVLFGCGGAMVIGAVLGLAAPAQAHNYLVSSTPAADSTLTELPDEFVITTNDDLLELGGDAGGFALEVRDADGGYYGDGCVAVDGASMTSTPALGAPGLYTVIWQVVSADGHTVSDEFSFTWAPDGAAEVSAGASSPPICGSASETADEEAPNAAAADPVANGSSGDLLWIGGTVVAVVGAVGLTLLVVRAKRSAGVPDVRS